MPAKALADIVRQLQRVWAGKYGSPALFDGLELLPKTVDNRPDAGGTRITKFVLASEYEQELAATPPSSQVT